MGVPTFTEDRSDRAMSCIPGGGKGFKSVCLKSQAYLQLSQSVRALSGHWRERCALCNQRGIETGVSAIYILQSSVASVTRKVRSIQLYPIGRGASGLFL